ncbi:MAG: hypothetical protein ACRENB_06545 [Gemmatimonadales bacterium]
MRYLIETASAPAFLLTLTTTTLAQIPNPFPDGVSQTSHYNTVHCAGLKLVGASNVPAGPVRTYGFQGSCQLVDVQASNKKGFFGANAGDKSMSVVGVVWAKAAVTYDTRNGELREDVVVSGAKSGKVQMQLRCGSDPVLATAPCKQVAFQNGTGWDGFDRPWLNKVPVTAGRATLFEAVTLSKQSGGGGTPPPPPPPPKSSPPVPSNLPARLTPVTTPPAPAPIPARRLPPASAPVPNPVATAAIPTPFTIEVEALAGGAQATSGQFGVQPMAGFKPGWWGADAQLFWPASQVGAQLNLSLTVPRTGRYTVSLIFTAAPDYAIAMASLDGKPGVVFNGYAPGVSRDKIVIGMFDLSAGPHQLLVQVRGKDPKSTGFFVGLDQLVFEPN